MRFGILVALLALFASPTAALGAAGDAGLEEMLAFERELRGLACDFHVNCRKSESMDGCTDRPFADRRFCLFDPEAAQACLDHWRGARCVEGLEDDPSAWVFRSQEVFGSKDNPCARVFVDCPEWHTPEPDLTLAPSTSRVSPEVSVQVTVGKLGIAIDGVRASQLEVIDGVPGVPPEYKRGHLLVTVYDSLQEKWDDERLIAERQGREPTDTLSIIADRATPYAVIAEVVYTAGQARYSRMLFHVAGEPEPGADRCRIRTVETRLPQISPPTPDRAPTEAYKASVSITEDGYRVVPLAPARDELLALLGGTEPAEPDLPASFERELLCAELPCASPERYDHAGLQAHLAAIHGGSPPCSGIVLLPAPGIRWDTVVRAMDAVREAPATGEGQVSGTLFPSPVLGMSW